MTKPLTKPKKREWKWDGFAVINNSEQLLRVSGATPNEECEMRWWAGAMPNARLVPITISLAKPKRRK